MSKIRITTYLKTSGLKSSAVEGNYTPGLTELSDRLVDMKTEFRNGPKEKHTGPIRVEATFFDREEVEGFITYLNQLSGDLPIQEKTKRTYTKKEKTEPMREDSIDELIKHLKTSSKIKTQEDLVDYLRTLNFVFLTRDHFEDIKDPALVIEIKEKHSKYQVFIKQLKLAKDPANDKYDFQLFFLVKLIGTKVERVHCYVDGAYKTTIKKDWKVTGEIGIKVKQKFYAFPKAMDLEERAKWRNEDRKFQANPNYEPTKFYYKWKDQVTILKLQPKKGGNK